VHVLFIKQTRAYELLRSPVGSERWIRDRVQTAALARRES